MRRLGDLEAEIMDRLWTWSRPATVREVVDDINKTRPVAYTTVMTVTNILYNKGWLLRGKQGRAWLYTPVRSREAYAAALMEDGLGESKDRPAALVHFVENMSEEEQAALRKALRSRGTTGQGRVVNAAPALVGYTAAVGFVAPHLMLRGSWQHRAPALAAAVWHTLAISFSIGATLAAYNLAMPTEHLHADLVGLLHACGAGRGHGRARPGHGGAACRRRPRRDRDGPGRKLRLPRRTSPSGADTAPESAGFGRPPLGPAQRHRPAVRHSRRLLPARPQSPDRAQ